MPNFVATYGGITIDNVVNAQGAVALRVPGGNSIYSAVGARLWAEGVAASGIVPMNYPQSWLDALTMAGVDVLGICRIPTLTRDLFEWFFYNDDGSREDLLFISDAALRAAGFRFPDGWKQRLNLSPGELDRLKTFVRSKSVPASDIPGYRTDPTTEIARLTPHLARTDAVHLAPSTFDLHLAFVRWLSANRIFVSLDPGHYVEDIGHNQLGELLSGVNVFIPSEREVEEFLGQIDLRRAARYFAELGPRIVVIKQGARGSLVYEAEHDTFTEVPGYPSRVTDPTGCGDSYCGGFLAGYLETGDARHAAVYGTIAASITIEGFGADYALNFGRRDALHRLSFFQKLLL